MKLMVWGNNYYNQLGLDLGSYPPPIQNISQNPSGDEWIFASSGAIQTFAIKNDGTLWACGYGAYGALGTGDGISHNSLVPVGTDTDWAKVFGSYNRGFALKTDGTLWSWGDASSYSALGLGDNVDKWSPTQVGTSDLWIDIACGNSHTLGLMSNGTVWGWGYNSKYQLGLNDTTSRLVPTQITSFSSALKISAGMNHSLVVTDDGKLYGFGSNLKNQLGSSVVGYSKVPTQIGTDIDWLDAKGGYEHSIAIKTNGSIHGSGSDIGTGSASSVFIQIGTRTDWAKIFCGFSNGGNTTFVIDNNGMLYGFGDNDDYELNTGDTVYVLSPTIIGPSFSNWSLISEGNGGVVALLNLENDFWKNFHSQTEIHI